MAYDSGVKRAIGTVLLIALGGCDAGSQERRPQPATQAVMAPATEPVTPNGALTDEQLDYARRPITYFNDKCGKCHGNYGTYWLEGVIAGLGERKLREEVELMAAGPSQAPLEGLALEVQVAYHRSLADGRPFVTVIRDENPLAGEVTPGSRVLLISGGREHEAQVEEHHWRSTLRDATSVRVIKDGATTQLPLEEFKQGEAGVLHSHGGTSK